MRKLLVYRNSYKMSLDGIFPYNVVLYILIKKKYIYLDLADWYLEKSDLDLVSIQSHCCPAETFEILFKTFKITLQK